MAARRRYECGYCGQLAPAGNDHVPPKSFFSANASLPLRTVKACDSCNTGASAADEYFRDFVVQFAPVTTKPKAQPQIERFRRALAKPQKRSYAERTIRAFEEHEVVTPTGIHLGKQPFIRVNAELLQRATQRYVRGLFRFEFGNRVPDDYAVHTATNPEDAARERPAIERLLSRGTVAVIENGVFCYSYVVASDNPTVSAWLLVFYDVLPVVGVVGPQARSPVRKATRSELSVSLPIPAKRDSE